MWFGPSSSVSLNLSVDGKDRMLNMRTSFFSDKKCVGKTGGVITRACFDVFRL